MNDKLTILEQRMNLILWGMDMTNLPSGHIHTEQLSRLKERAEKKLTEGQKEAQIRQEYYELKSRIAILEEDYGRILK